MTVKYSTYYFVYMYFEINGVKYWIVVGPSGLMLYKKEGKAKYLGRRTAAEIKEMLAKADAETVLRIKSDLEAVRQALERQKLTQKTQTTQPSLTWKKDSHTYWLLYDFKTIYIYVKGPTTRYKPKLVEKTDVAGAADRLVAAGAAHVLEALRLLINELADAVSDLLKPPERTADLLKPQATSHGVQRARREAPPRREAEEALRELKSALRRAVKKWDEEWRMKGSMEEPDKWLREKLKDFIDEHIHLIEKMQPYEDLLDKFADAVAEATTGHITRSDALEILKP